MGSFLDRATMADGLSVGIESTLKPPSAPCKSCGSETKEHHPVKDNDGKVIERRRICSNRACRKVLKMS